MVEKEARADGERPWLRRFSERLNSHMPLQSESDGRL